MTFRDPVNIQLGLVSSWSEYPLPLMLMSGVKVTLSTDDPLKTSLWLEEARRVTEEFVTYYNEIRLQSASDYIAPRDKLEGLAGSIFAERDRKLEFARDKRKAARKSIIKSGDPLEDDEKSLDKREVMENATIR